jgi:lipoyl(octanoyl) transferase 2
MVILRHVHLPNLTTYAHASRLQQILVTNLLSYKARLSERPSTNPELKTRDPPILPPPTILTFSPHPIYTTGRRESIPPSPEQLQFLQRPLETEQYGIQTPSFAQALRGGQITFHGPGQLVIYPIISLSNPYSFSPPPPASSTSSSSSSAKKTLKPRCYIHLLENATIQTLKKYGLKGIRTENPGVWVDEETKIAALGVHLRRNVTSHGVGVNVRTDLRWFERIVACGLEGKGVTSMEVEMGKRKGEKRVPSVEEVAGVWVGNFARECGLGEGDVVRVGEEDILAESLKVGMDDEEGSIG